MKTLEQIFANDKAPNILATASDTISINLPKDINIRMIDVTLMIDSGDTYSKDITFSLTDINSQNQDFAFWDDSTLTHFTVFNKLTNGAFDTLVITILNNDATNAIQVDQVFVKFYYED